MDVLQRIRGLEMEKVQAELADILMDLVCIIDSRLRGRILTQYSEFRWSVLTEALDSLQKPVLSIAEIGVYRGLCSLFLRYCFPTANRYLIDPWELGSTYEDSDGPVTIKESEMREAFNSVTRCFQNDPLTHILKKTSKEASSLVPDSLDLVFIDGNHDYEYVKEDIELWLPKVRSGGILAGHDYDLIENRFPGVKRAVDELFGDQISIGKDNVWMYIKK